MRRAAATTLAHLVPDLALGRRGESVARQGCHRDTRIVSVPTTVDDIIARLRAIDAEFSPDDGVAVFNRMYLTVTERIAAAIVDATTFGDSSSMSELDVRFANLWLAAYDADAARRTLPTVWQPLFEERRAGRLPIQYAVAGMNSHIEHDLPIAVVGTCRARGLEPDDLHADYEAVNKILAQVESPIRRSFLDARGHDVDSRFGPAVHLLSTWDIEKARDLAWVTAETIWELRRADFVCARFLDGLSHTVGMTSRALLTPV